MDDERIDTEVEVPTEDIMEYSCIYFDSGVCSHDTKDPWSGEVTPEFCRNCEERFSPNPPNINKWI